MYQPTKKIEGWPGTKNKKKPAAAKMEEENNNSSSNLYFSFHDSINSNNIPGNNDHQFLLHDHQSSSLVLPELQPILEPQPPPPDLCNWLLVPEADQPANFGVANNNNDHLREQQFGLDIVGNGNGGTGSSGDLCDWLLSDDVDQPLDFGVVADNDDFFKAQAQQFALDTLDVNEYSNGNVVGNDEGTSSGVNGESTSDHHHHHLALENHVNVCQNFPGNNNNSSSGFGSPVLEVLPAADGTDLLPPPYILLREISHTNGIQVRNLEIYGLIGMISHAVVYNVDPDTSPGNLDYQLFNFSGESLSNVKNFLVQYCEDRKKEGYWMVQDPFVDFFQAVCVGINVNPGDNTILQPLVASDIGSSGVKTTGGSSSNQEYSATSYQQEVADRNGVRRSKINLSKQRERTGKLKLKDFSMYFDLRITDVAEKLNVCPTVVKKKCREAGLNRWPYRKIKGLKRKIKAKKDCLMIACTDAERSQNMLEIQMLEQQLQDIYTKLEHLQM